MKRFVLGLMGLVCGAWATAGVIVGYDGPVRVQSNYDQGGVALGVAHSVDAPLLYVSGSGASSWTDDMFWYFEGTEESGLYRIRNASTGEYISYDGVYEGTYLRYLTVDTELYGDSSLWEITEESAGLQIVCYADVESPYLNLRTTSYAVGGYVSQVSTNSLWTLWTEDEEELSVVDDTLVLVVDTTDTETETDSLETDTDDSESTEADWTYGVDYGVEEGAYWENTGLDMPVALTTDLSDPILYTIQNVRSTYYLQRDESDNYLIQTSSDPTEFYFVEGDDGVNIYLSDGYYMSGYVKSISTKAALAVSGTTSTSDNTWALGYYETENPGYTVGVQTCSDNSTSSGNQGGFGGWGGIGSWGTTFDSESAYWNDLNYESICYYSIDGGSTFVFYSTDDRHRDYLVSQGVPMPHKDSVPQTMDAVVDTLWVNGRMAIFDDYWDVYMATVPEEYRSGAAFDVPVDVSLSGIDDTIVVSIVVNGDTISRGESYPFELVGYDDYNTIAVVAEGQTLAEGNLTFTWLPIVELNGTFSSSYAQGSIRVTDPESLEPVDSLYTANAKWRGATAMGYTKKAYAIKLKDSDGETSIDRSFLGMREDNNWILDAMAIDPSRMRNRVSTDLWLDFSTPPYHSAKEPKAKNGTTGRMVEVLLNGKYHGIYCMTEKVDRKQLKLKKIDMADATNEDTIRGVLYKSEGWSYSVFMGHNSDSQSYPRTYPTSYKNTSMTWNEWEMKYPDLDDGESIDWGPLYEAICIPATYDDDDFVDSVGVYFDIPVWRDYYLFLDLLLATDNHGKNMFIYNYNIQKYKMTSLAVWDLDGVFGRRWDGGTYYTSDYTQDFSTFCINYEHGEHTMFYRLRNLDYENWADSLAERYAELRSTYFTVDGLVERFADYRADFYESGAEARELARWDGTDGVSLDWDEEMDYLEEWITGRLETLDEEFGYDPEVAGISAVQNYIGVSGGEGCINLNADRAQTIRVYSLDGRLVKAQNVGMGLSKISGLQSGVYIVAGKKVMVR